MYWCQSLYLGLICSWTSPHDFCRTNKLSSTNKLLEWFSVLSVDSAACINDIMNELKRIRFSSKPREHAFSWVRFSEKLYAASKLRPAVWQERKMPLNVSKMSNLGEKSHAVVKLHSRSQAGKENAGSDPKGRILAGNCTWLENCVHTFG